VTHTVTVMTDIKHTNLHTDCQTCNIHSVCQLSELERSN